MRTIKYIVFHCTATPQSTTVESIQWYWRNHLKWRNPGYHHLIKPDGQIVDLLPIDKIANGVRGYNRESIHISYIGGVHWRTKEAIDNRTGKQFLAQLQLLHKYKNMFPDAKVLGHRDFPNVNKDCPSFEVKDWLESVKM